MKEISRKVTLLKKNKNNSFQMANVKVIDANGNPEIIGTTVSAVAAMTSNDEEMKMVLPEIMGISPTSPDWQKEVKNYWNSICVYVTGSGKSLEIGFNYDFHDETRTKYITLTGAKDEDGLIQYCETKLAKDPTFYKMMYRYATPLNKEDYLLYRYCMGYRDVANHHNNVDTHQHIRLYIFDEEVQKKIVAQDSLIKRESIIKLSELYGKRDALLDVLYVFESDAVTQDETAQDIAIELIASGTPVEFLATVKDKNITNKAMIQKYIRAGILKKVPLGTTILDNESGDPIGKDLDETLLWFKTPTNSGTVADYAKRFKELKTNK